MEEALREWVERKRGAAPRREVLAHLTASVQQHRELYRHLAQ